MTLFVEKDIRQQIPFGHYFWAGMFKTYQKAEESLFDSLDKGEIDALDMRRAHIVKNANGYFVTLPDYNLTDR